METKKNVKNKMFSILLVYASIIALNLLGILFGEKLPWFLAVLIAQVAIVCPAIILVKLQREKLSDVVLFKKIKVSTLFKTLLITIAATPIYMFVNLLSQLFVPNTMVQASQAMFEGSPIPAFILTCVVAPFCEEITFRGIFMNEIKTSVKVWAAIIISAVMFGIAHLNINQFCYALVLGIVFAAVNEASGTVITSMIMHFLVNLFGTGLLYVQLAIAEASGMDYAAEAESIRQGDVIKQALPVYAVLAAIGTVVTILLIKSIAKKEKTILDIEDNSNTDIEQ